MRLLLGLFTIIFLAGCHEARETDVGQNRQSNEGEQSRSTNGNREVVGAVKTYEEDEANMKSVEDKMGSNLRVAEDFTPLVISQSTIHSYNGNQQTNGLGAQQIAKQQQDYISQVSGDGSRGFNPQEMATQQQSQSSQPQNTFYLDDSSQKIQKSLRQSMKSETFEQEQPSDNGMQAENANNQHQRLKMRKVINMGLFQKDDWKSRARQHLIIRLEPDSQEQDNILKAYEALKMKRQKLIQHKRLFMESSLFESKQLIKQTSRKQDIQLYCLIAALSAVIALPLLIALFKKKPPEKQESFPITRNGIPKSTPSS